MDGGARLKPPRTHVIQCYIIIGSFEVSALKHDADTDSRKEGNSSYCNLGANPETGGCQNKGITNGRTAAALKLQGTDTLFKHEAVTNRLKLIKVTLGSKTNKTPHFFLYGCKMENFEFKKFICDSHRKKIPSYSISSELLGKN